MKKVFVLSALIGLLTTVAYLPITHSQGNFRFRHQGNKFRRTQVNKRVTGQYLVVLNNDVSKIHVWLLLRKIAKSRSRQYKVVLTGVSIESIREICRWMVTMVSTPPALA